jgi:hypothetical protein
MKTKRLPRWGSRQEGMAHGKFGATTMNKLMRDKKIIAKKDGVKVKVDLNSIDDYLESLPNVGDE